MTTPEQSGLNVAAELAALRGEMTTGFADIKGQLTLIAERQTATADDVAKLEARVSALEARRWPIGSVVAISGVVSAAFAGLAVWVGQ